MGNDADYIPGWDCHGLPSSGRSRRGITAKGKKQTPDAVAMLAFRAECRAYAQHWLEVQREEFKRLGVEGDWDDPYTTMGYAPKRPSPPS